MTQPYYPPGAGYAPPAANPYGQPAPAAPAAGYAPAPHAAPPQAAPAAPMAGGLPQLHLPDQALVDNAYAAAQEAAARAAAARAGGGGKAPFFQPLGPNGETKWAQQTVPVGYSASYLMWVMPSDKPGQMPYVIDQSHFCRTADNPGGKSLGHVDGNCHFCTSRDMLFKTGSEEDAKRAKNNGRLGRKALYQIALLEHPQSHMREDGTMTPWIFRAPGGIHDDIVDKMRTLTPMRLLDPQHGRPIIVTKKKTGPSAMDVEWKVDTFPDAQPLDPFFYPLFQKLHDLDKFVKKPSLKEQMETIMGAGFPMPPELPGLVQQEQAQVQAAAAAGGAAYGNQPAYAAGHNPPHANPYGAPPQAAVPPPAAAPYGAAPPAAAPPYMQQPAAYPTATPAYGVDPNLAALQNQMKG